MTRYIACLYMALIFTSFTAISQTETRTGKLRQLSREFEQKEQQQRAEALDYAAGNNIPVTLESDGAFQELKYMLNGIPQYYITANANAAISISTDDVFTGGIAGLGLSGSGITVREWDGGNVLTTHQEFGGRATLGDVSSTQSSHATHVAGTIIAAGIVPSAKGMAWQADLKGFDWVFDGAEMAAEAAEGMLLSNHSYIFIRGWHWNGSAWEWHGDPEVSTVEDYLFGFYDEDSQAWDQIAYDAPYYLICNAAGNERDDGPGTDPPDDGPYDCICQLGIAKNILTVGAVADVTGGYSGPGSVIMTNFSSWGPADDGRIKPDICANGLGLYSTINADNAAYGGNSGTSMAAPSVTGSMALLQEHFENLNGDGSYMLAATLKALVIHTADETGDYPGPDYQFGWGLMNTHTAADKISEDQISDVLSELVLEEGGSYSREVMALGTMPLKVTIVWTDVPGTPLEPQLDPLDPMLVNDLDLKIVQGGNIFYPWKLDRDNPSSAATNNAENDVDNVEVVFIEEPAAGPYTIIVDHDGVLENGSQAYSMIISGIDLEAPPMPDFLVSMENPEILESIDFSDISLGNPTAWSWTFSGPGEAIFTGSTSMNSQNPSVLFTESGSYDVTLLAANNHGGNMLKKTAYVDVQACTPCSSESVTPTYFWISNVSFNTIDNYSTESTYSDYTGMSTEVLPGEAYDFSAAIGTTSGYGVFTSVFIDWNRNCDFSDPGETYELGLPSSGMVNTEIIIPSDVVSGPVLMRVILRYNQNPVSCGSYNFGETEDYTINILERAVDLKVYLEGPFKGPEMATDLSQSIPLAQPYSVSPWYYPGSENVAVIPNSEVVDWVLLELRDAVSADLAASSKVIERQACFLLKDGSVRATDGSSYPTFGLPFNDGLFVVIWHRNHLGIMSATPLDLDQGTYLYDFSTSMNKAYGGMAGHNQISPGVWGMMSGDGDGNGSIGMEDKSPLWTVEAGASGYLNTDYNLDGQANNKDKDDRWLPNLGKGSQVPD